MQEKTLLVFTQESRHTFSGSRKSRRKKGNVTKNHELKYVHYTCAAFNPIKIFYLISHLCETQNQGFIVGGVIRG